MIKSSTNITEVKELIGRLKDKRVDVTLDLGRNKRVNFSGTLTGVYPALFTVCPENKDFKGKTSYSYSEYMCGRVALKEQPAN